MYAVTTRIEKLCELRELFGSSPRRKRPGKSVWRVEAAALVHEIRACAEQISAARHWDGELAFRSDPQWHLLQAIERIEACPSIADLARVLHISRQAARELVIKAARSSSVELFPNSDDRRIIRVVLSRTGKSMLHVAREREKAWVIEIFNGLDSREMRRIAHVLSVIRYRILRRLRQRSTGRAKKRALVSCTRSTLVCPRGRANGRQRGASAYSRGSAACVGGACARRA